MINRTAIAIKASTVFAGLLLLSSVGAVPGIDLPAASAADEATVQDHNPNGDNRLAGPQPAECSFTGKWHSEKYGDMRLRQTGDRVNGSYDHKDGEISGTVSFGDGGKRLAGPQGEALRLKGTWEQAPTYQGDDAGDFVFELPVEECDTITGSWGHGKGKGTKFQGDWNLVRLDSKEPWPG